MPKRGPSDKSFQGRIVSSFANPPANSKLIAVVDADVWRSFAVPMHDAIAKFIPADARPTGMYIDLISMLSTGLMVSECVATRTVEYECTHRIEGKKIEFGEDVPEFDRLSPVFASMPSFDRNGVETPGNGRYGGAFSNCHVIETEECARHLKKIDRLYDKMVERAPLGEGAHAERLAAYIGNSSKDAGERTMEAFARVENRIQGPVYFISNDKKARERISQDGVWTPNGRAIGVVSPSGLLTAMLGSGFTKQKGMREPRKGGDSIYNLIRDDLNRKNAWHTDTETIVAWRKATDRAGSFVDGVQGLTLESRLKGEAIDWKHERLSKADQLKLDQQKGHSMGM